MTIIANIESQVAGYFTFEKWKVDAAGAEVEGTRHQPVPSFRNLITNGGLDRMAANSDYLNCCQVGSGSTPPTNSNSALVSKVASVFNYGGVTAAQPNPPYFGSETRQYTFPVGSATGNISEVGVGWGDTGTLFSRALVVDGAGNPTTITVLADEILQVTYQVRYYPPLEDLSGSVVLGGATYNWVGRASGVTTGAYWRAGTSQGLGNAVFDGAYDGVIGATIVDLPNTVSAQYSGPTSAVDDTYNAGTYTRSGQLTWSLDKGNFPGGIGAIFMVHGNGSYQFGFTPKIPKNNTQTLKLNFSHSWARKAI